MTVRSTLRADLVPLRIPAFRKYWFGRAISSFGDGMIPVVTAFAVLGVGGGPGALGVVLAIGMVARVLSALVGGVVADRTLRRGVMMLADAVRFAVQVALGIALLTGHNSVLMLVVGNAVYGVAAGLYGPAAGGFLPSMVPKDLLQQANALQALTRSMFMIGGPAIAGVLIPLAGTGTVYLIDGLTFAINVLALVTIRVEESRREREHSFGRDLATGWREVIGRPWLSLNLLAHASWNFGIAAFFVLGPVLTAREHGGSAAWGAVSAGLSGGALVGGAVALRWRPTRPLVAGNLALTLAAAPLLSLYAHASVVVLVAAAVVCNSGLVLLNELWTATMQRIIPEDVLSRVMSYDWLISLITLPLGYALVGPAANRIGERPTLLVAVVLTVLPVGLVCLVPTIRRLTGPTRE